MERLRVPARLDGLRILDIGPWNGFFSFECVRRGAAEVISLGPDDPDATGYNKTLALLEIDNCKFTRASVYDLLPEKHGSFDMVFFIGVIYHLRHPLLALDRIFDVCKNRLFVDSPVIDTTVYDKTITNDLKEKILKANTYINQLPMLYFTKGAETGDVYNWFMPNSEALRGMVESSGFQIDNYHRDCHDWASMSAIKKHRSFTIGIEGWSPEAASRLD